MENIALLLSNVLIKTYIELKEEQGNFKYIQFNKIIIFKAVL